MIGFQLGLKAEQPQSDEGPDTVHLSKNQLYDTVNQTYLLPPPGSRGVTRDYLLRVHRDQVFRVTHHVYKHFEVDLAPNHLKKTTLVNCAMVVKKLNLLLAERRQSSLGFTHFEVPESAWLMKVARYIDQTNLLECFEAAVVPEGPVTDASPITCKVYHGRKNASEYIFRLPDMRESRGLWDQLKLVHETYKYLSTARLGIELLD